jgi:hypothetical protein
MGLAQDNRPGRFQAGHYRGVVGGDLFSKDRRATGGPQAGGVEDIFNPYWDTMQGATSLALL